MEIISIFDGTLYAFKYDNEARSELHKRLELWQDQEYVFSFLKENKADVKSSLEQVAQSILDDADEIEDELYELAETGKLNPYFEPLYDKTYKFEMYQKGKRRKLRLYAIKIEDHCFIITGGAIKLTPKMQDRPHTQRERDRLDECQTFLENHEIENADLLYEFLHNDD